MKNLTKIWEFLLEVLFPSGLIEKRVRQMSIMDLDSIKEIEFDPNNNILSFFKYKNPLVREVIKQIKYKKNKRLAKMIAEIIYSELLENISEMELFENFDNPILVPVPMSKREKRDRGYNQVELLIDEIVRVENLSPDFNLLRKIRDTERQTKLKKEKRLKNIKGAFNPTRFNLVGLNIILIDDVMTTGATINEAKKVLEKNGAKVFVVVVAI
jgi:competence protein ComFC